MRRICATRAWKRAQGAGASAARSGVAALLAGPLFQGTVYLVNLRLSGRGGTLAISDADFSMVNGYLARAIVPIERYASQYGLVRLATGPPLPPFDAAAPGGRYNDQQLQGWIQQIAQANRLPAGSSLVVLNPPSAVNVDAQETGGVGVLGYHGFAGVPYGFVNILGSGFTLDDRADLYAEALSHEVAEMTVDPQANGSNPEVCDGCGTNCLGRSAYRSFFDSVGRFLSSDTAFPPPFAFSFFISAIARPAAASDCPAPSASCAYPPPGA